MQPGDAYPLMALMSLVFVTLLLLGSRRAHTAYAESLRDADLLFRWGGEEFMVLAPNTDLAGAYLVADRMRCELEQLSLVPVGIITCSFGCSQFDANDTADTFIQRADRALYVAKDNGRNCVKTA